MRSAEKGVVETPASDASCSLNLPVEAGDDGCTGRWEDEVAASSTEAEACDVDALGSGAAEGDRGERGGGVCGVFVEGPLEGCATDVFCEGSCLKGARRLVGLPGRVSAFAESLDVRGVEPEDDWPESDPPLNLLFSLFFSFLI